MGGTMGKGYMIGRIGHLGNTHDIFNIDAKAVPHTEKKYFPGELPSFQPVLISETAITQVLTASVLL